jgi:hypothetical protein
MPYGRSKCCAIQLAAFKRWLCAPDKQCFHFIDTTARPSLLGLSQHACTTLNETNALKKSPASGGAFLYEMEH